LNMDPGRASTGALMAKNKDNGTKKATLYISLAVFVLAFLIAFGGIILYASDIKGCAEGAHIRIDAVEKSLDKIDSNVDSIKTFLMGSPKKK